MMLKPYYDNGQVEGTVSTVASCVDTQESEYTNMSALLKGVRSHLRTRVRKIMQ